MLDNPEKTTRLLTALKAAVPFEVEVLPSVVKRLQSENCTITNPAGQVVSDLSYAGDEGGIVCVLALFLVVAGWNMKSENPVARIRDECQKSYGNLGPARVSECLSELVIRHTRRSNLP